jgi:hypothetical protein
MTETKASTLFLTTANPEEAETVLEFQQAARQTNKDTIKAQTRSARSTKKMKYTLEK